MSTIPVYYRPLTAKEKEEVKEKNVEEILAYPGARDHPKNLKRILRINNESAFHIEQDIWKKPWIVDSMVDIAGLHVPLICCAMMLGRPDIVNLLIQYHANCEARFSFELPGQLENGQKVYKNTNVVDFAAYVYKDALPKDSIFVRNMTENRFEYSDKVLEVVSNSYDRLVEIKEAPHLRSLKKLIREGSLEEIRKKTIFKPDEKVPVKGIKIPQICYSMMVDRPDVFDILIENGADVNQSFYTLYYPLSFIIYGCKKMFGRGIKNGPAYAEKLLKSHALINSSVVIGTLQETRRNIQKYITLLLDYGAKFDELVFDENTPPAVNMTWFMCAAGNINPKALQTLIEEAKKRLPKEKFLKLLQYKDKFFGDIEKCISNTATRTLSSKDKKYSGKLLAYWEKERIELKKYFEELDDKKVQFKKANDQLKEKSNEIEDSKDKSPPRPKTLKGRILNFTKRLRKHLKEYD